MGGSESFPAPSLVHTIEGTTTPPTNSTQTMETDSNMTPATTNVPPPAISIQSPSEPSSVPMVDVSLGPEFRPAGAGHTSALPTTSLQSEQNMYAQNVQSIDVALTQYGARQPSGVAMSQYDATAMRISSPDSIDALGIASTNLSPPAPGYPSAMEQQQIAMHHSHQMYATQGHPGAPLHPGATAPYGVTYVQQHPAYATAGMPLEYQSQQHAQQQQALIQQQLHMQAMQLEREQAEYNNAQWMHQQQMIAAQQHMAAQQQQQQQQIAMQQQPLSVNVPSPHPMTPSARTTPVHAVSPSPSTRASLFITDPSTTPYTKRPPSGAPSPHYASPLTTPRGGSRYPIPSAAEVCLTRDHEVLTKDKGWCPIEAVQKGDEVWSILIDQAHLPMEWSRVTETHRLPAPATLFHLSSDSLNCVATPAHRWPIREGVSTKISWRRTDELIEGMQLVATGLNSNLDCCQIDSTLLHHLGVDLRQGIISPLLVDSSFIMQLSNVQARTILAGFTDGTEVSIIASSEHIRDILQLVAMLAGVQMAAIRDESAWKIEFSDAGKPIDGPTFLSLGAGSIQRLSSHDEADVFCVTVDNGNFYTRRNDGLRLCGLFTGNCKPRPEALYQPPQCFSPLTSTTPKSYNFPGLYSTAINKMSLHFPHSSSTSVAALYTKEAMTPSSTSSTHGHSHNSHHSSHHHHSHHQLHAATADVEMQPQEDEGEDEADESGAGGPNLMGDLLSAASQGGLKKSKVQKVREGTNASSKTRREEEQPQLKRKVVKPKPSADEDYSADEPETAPKPVAKRSNRPKVAAPPAAPAPVSVPASDEQTSAPPSAPTSPKATPKKKEIVPSSPSAQPSTITTPLTSPAPKPRQTRTSQLASNDVIEELAKSIAQANADAKKLAKQHAKEVAAGTTEMKSEASTSSSVDPAPVVSDAPIVTSEFVLVGVESTVTCIADPPTPPLPTVKGEVEDEAVMMEDVAVANETTPSAASVPAHSAEKASKKSKQDKRRREPAAPTIGPNGEIIPPRGRGRPAKPKPTPAPVDPAAVNAQPANTIAPASSSDPPSRTASPLPSIEQKEPSSEDVADPPVVAMEDVIDEPVTKVEPSTNPSPVTSTGSKKKAGKVAATPMKAQPEDKKEDAKKPVEPIDEEEARKAELRRAEELNEKYVTQYLHLYEQTEQFASSTSRTRHQASANTTPAGTVAKRAGKKPALQEKPFNPKTVLKSIKAHEAELVALAQRNKADAASETHSTGAENDGAAPKTEFDASSTVESIAPSNASPASSVAAKKSRSGRSDLLNASADIEEHTPVANGNGKSAASSPESSEAETDDSSHPSEDENGASKPKKSKPRLSELDRLHELNQSVFSRDEKKRRAQLRKQQRAERFAKKK